MKTCQSLIEMQVGSSSHGFKHDSKIDSKYLSHETSLEVINPKKTIKINMTFNLAYLTTASVFYITNRPDDGFTSDSNSKRPDAFLIA